MFFGCPFTLDVDARRFLAAGGVDLSECATEERDQSHNVTEGGREGGREGERERER